MNGATVTVGWPTGALSVDLAAAAQSMTATQQRKLFHGIGHYITPEDCQFAMDNLADAIVESRKRAAQEILDGKWPVQPPIPVSALRRFVAAQKESILSICKKPKLYFEEEIK